MNDRRTNRAPVFLRNVKKSAVLFRMNEQNNRNIPSNFSSYL